MKREENKRWQKEEKFDKIDIESFSIMEEDLTSGNLPLIL